MLYFMRSFKPALARDYDVFFAAIGLLCGGILFFQGWRLDPILQFGQFLLAGTTVFFAYESVRLRGVSAEQARRSAYFDDEPASRAPAGGMRGYDDDYDRFDEPQPVRRRFAGQDFDEAEGPEQDFYRPRRNSRAAIPEQAASRRRGRAETASDWSGDSEQDRRMARFGNRDDERTPSGPSFGDRRSQRDDQRRGSRPSAAARGESSAPASPRAAGDSKASGSRPPASSRTQMSGQPGVPQGTPFRQAAEDAAYSPSRRPSSTSTSTASSSGSRPQDPGRTPPRSSRPRDNSSRFDA